MGCTMIPIVAGRDSTVIVALRIQHRFSYYKFLLRQASESFAALIDNLPERREGFPVLKKLGLPTKFAGLHAFRHGLATELADRGAPIPVLQQQMRHADVRTTLRIYAHAIPQSQRDAMEAISIGTNNQSK